MPSQQEQQSTQPRNASRGQLAPQASSPLNDQRFRRQNLEQYDPHHHVTMSPLINAALIGVLLIGTLLAFYSISFTVPHPQLQ